MRNKILMGAVAVCFAAVAMQPLRAQAARKLTRKTVNGPRPAALVPTGAEVSPSGQYSAAELEEMRTQILNLHNHVEQLGGMARQGTVDLDTLRQAKSKIQTLSYRQLNVIRQSISPSAMNAALQQAQKTINDYVEQQKTARSSAAGRQKPKFVDGSGFPVPTDFCESQSTALANAQQGNDSASASGGTLGSTDTPTTASTGSPVAPTDVMTPVINPVDPSTLRIPVGVVLAVDIIVFVADTVKDVAQDACKEDILGENASLACIAVDILAVVADAVGEGVHFCDDDLTANVIDTSYVGIADVHSDLFNIGTSLDNHLTNVNTDIDTNLTNDFTSLTTTVNSDATVTDTLITNDFNALTTQITQGTALLQAYLKQIMKLQLTPQGLQKIVPAILTCTGTNCPNVLANCPAAGCSWNNVGPLP
jgi:hypothetical protein